MAIKNVVLVGATGGTIGPVIYQALKASPSNFNITLLTRPAFQSKQPEGATVIKHDYSDPALIDALRGQDAIVTAVSSFATLSQIPLIDAAVKAGVKKFIATEYGCDTLNPVLPPRLSTYAEKKKVHDYLVKTADENLGFSFAALINGPLFDWGLSIGFLGYDLNKHQATILDGGDIKVSYTAIPQVALGVAKILERDISGYLYISSLTVSQNEIVDALERVTGEKFERKEEMTENYHRMSEQMMKSADQGVMMNGFVLRILAIAYSADANPGWGNADNAKLGLEEGKLDDLVRDALGKQ